MRLIIKSLQSWVTTIQFNYIACCFPVHLLSIKPFLHFLAAAVASGHHLITGPLGHPTHATLECIKGTRGSLCSSYPCLRWGVGAMRYISGMTGGIYDSRDILCQKFHKYAEYSRITSLTPHLGGCKLQSKCFRSSLWADCRPGFMESSGLHEKLGTWHGSS